MTSTFRNVLILTAVLAVANGAYAEKPHIAREGIEWCEIWIPEADNNTKLPRVLLIGDSIANSYHGKVADLLRGKVSVSKLATSKSVGDPLLLAEVALVLDQGPFDVVHFNNGLHGRDYSEAEYRTSFPELIATIRKHAPNAKLIWRTSTPTHPAGDNSKFDEFTARVKVRNQIAKEIVTKEGIPIDDLFGLVADHSDYFSPDGVHFSGKGVEVAAADVAEQILKSLKK